MAVKGKGAKMWLWDTAGAGALVQIGEVTSITPPQRSRDTIDTTHHESTGDYREFISSLIDAGEATFVVNHVPGSTSDLLIEARLAGGAINPFAIDVNNAAGTTRRINGSCIVTGYEPGDVVIDDKMSATITIKVSGPITFA